jgi:hypothetical protein
MNIKTIKKIGIGASILGAVLGLVSTWASDKQQEARIDEQVTKKFAELMAASQSTETVVNRAN